MENKNVANPEQVRQFLDLCQPDSLAIGIGNAHGYYKGEPDIKLEVLEEVRKFTDIPFVLHGCTGMREDIIKEAIKLGVAKINFGTEIRYKYVEHYEEALKTNHQGHSWKLSQLANDALTEDIKRSSVLQVQKERPEKIKAIKIKSQGKIKFRRKYK